MGDSSSDESDSDDNKDQRVLKENKKNTDLKDDATKTFQAAVYKLCRQRLCAQERMANSTKRMFNVLVEQRHQFELRRLDYAFAKVGSQPMGNDRVDCLARAERAYSELDTQLASFKSALSDVRTAEIELSPTLRFLPNTIAFAVSAPGTSWAVEEWNFSAFPRIASFMRQAFCAGFSSGNMKAIV